MDTMSFIPIPAIALILYCVAELLKATLFNTDQRRAMIPVVCALLGAVICVVLYAVQPGLIPGDNILTAAAEGIISGLTATGANQVYWQIKKNVNTANADDTNNG